MPSNYSWGREKKKEKNQTPDIEPHIYKLRHIQDSTRSTATQTAAPRRPESDLWHLQNTVKITLWQLSTATCPEMNRTVFVKRI